MSNTSNEQVLTTADGVPLKISQQKALRKRKITALLLVSPLFVFILITFLIPIFDMLLRSIDNKIVPESIPSTIELISEWDSSSGELPNEGVFKAFILDLKKASKEHNVTRLGRRLNYEKPGVLSLFRKTSRKINTFDYSSFSGSYKEYLFSIDKRWQDISIWRLLKQEGGIYTASYYLSANDLKIGDDGDIELKPENRRLYIGLFIRTLFLSLLITLLTVALGYPIAYLLSTIPTKTSNLLMILVSLPFLTSLLVRTSAWIALLQKEGVINDLLVASGVISTDNRLEMIHNTTGTIIAMTHILLPFMILPLYSVMKTIPPSYVRAARSMGATPFAAFRAVYFPNTIPGIGAGAILVFILAIGYYITPALVGGTSGTLISNFIAYHISTSLNWGLAAALGTILLLLVLALYILYDKIVGINNIKLG